MIVPQCPLIGKGHIIVEKVCAAAFRKRIRPRRGNSLQARVVLPAPLQPAMMQRVEGTGFSAAGGIRQAAVVEDFGGSGLVASFAPGFDPESVSMA